MERSGRYPNHVLNDWFGHSGTIAETYYLQTTEDDYAEALRETAASESHSVGTSVGTSAREQDPSLEISAKEKPHKTGTLITVDGFWSKPSVHPEDVHQRRATREITRFYLPVHSWFMTDRFD